MLHQRLGREKECICINPSERDLERGQFKRANLYVYRQKARYVRVECHFKIIRLSSIFYSMVSAIFFTSAFPGMQVFSNVLKNNLNEF